MKTENKLIATMASSKEREAKAITRFMRLHLSSEKQCSNAIINVKKVQFSRKEFVLHNLRSLFCVDYLSRQVVSCDKAF